MAKVVTGEFETKRGAAIFRSAAQRFSEVQVTAGAGAGLAIVAGCGFDLMAAGTFVLGRETIGWSFCAANGLGAVPVDDQTSGTGSSGGGVAQPAKKISAQKMIPTVLDTPPLCGTRKRTQAVLVFS
jgi:hypothetical protein